MLKDGKWVPTFPNARYLIGKTEYEHWTQGPEGETAEIMTDFGRSRSSTPGSPRRWRWTIASRRRSA